MISRRSSLCSELQNQPRPNSNLCVAMKEVDRLNKKVSLVQDMCGCLHKDELLKFTSTGRHSHSPRRWTGCRELDSGNENDILDCC